MNPREKLTATVPFKASMCALVVVTVALIIIFEFKAHMFAISVPVMIFAASQMKSYYLSELYIKKRAVKIIHQELKEVRQLLWWWIIIDEYGDSIWVNYSSLSKENKAKLDAWLTPRH